MTPHRTRFSDRTALPAALPMEFTMERNIATLWQTCLSFEYDREALVSSLAQWIWSTGKKDILDCACGTGFPALDLISRGFQLTCSDGSPAMLDAFRRNADLAGLQVCPHHILWRDLSFHFRGQFDIVFCRGSSLIYADAWDALHRPDNGVIADALRNFLHCLRPGGILYIDTTSEHGLNGPFPETRSYPDRLINGRSVNLTEIVHTDRVTCTRTWISRLSIDGVVSELTRRSLFLPHDALVSALYRAGFAQVSPCSIPGEHYAVFLAYRL
jgi:SAM-dependent methyltransferase